jgi:hypothetical protein
VCWFPSGLDTHASAERAAASVAVVPEQQCIAPEVASLSCCNFAAAQVAVMVSLSGGHLLWSGFVVTLIAESFEVLAFELGEADAVGGVADVEVQDGPDEGQAAGLAGEPSDYLGAALDFAE